LPHHRAGAVTLSRRALYQDVAERLRQQIFNRQLEPGSWIDELKLAAEYGISRTPLREALKVLAVEGLVTMKVRRGAYVTEMSATTWRRSTTCWRCWKATPPAAWPRMASDAQIAELQRPARPAGEAGAPARRLLRHQRAVPPAPAGPGRQPLERGRS
jgi:DNA-binding GntR family transcriptional regulator